MSQESGKIFNVAEPAHASEFQTTAGQALVDAPAGSASHSVEKTTDQAHLAAEQAAKAAKSLGSGYTGTRPTALETVKDQLSATTNAAVGEGHRDVNAAQSTGNTYMAQAQAAVGELASTVQAAAATYLPSSVTGQQSDVGSAGLPTHTSRSTDINTSTSTGTGAAGIIPTIQQYANQALAAAQPTLDRATAAAQPHLEKAFGSTTTNETHTTPAQSAHFAPASSTGIPGAGAPVPAAHSTTAPLHSGGKTVSGPYDTVDAKKIAENSAL